MQALTRQDIMAAFDAVDRPNVVEPALQWVAWNDLDYFSWRHPSEAKVFVVVPSPERLVGLVFRVMTGPTAGMCDLCYGIDRMNGSMMALTDCWRRPRRAIGLRVCSNFDCSDGARGLKWIYNMGETISAGRRVERLQENLAAFVRRVTGPQS